MEYTRDILIDTLDEPTYEQYVLTRKLFDFFLGNRMFKTILSDIFDWETIFLKYMEEKEYLHYVDTAFDDETLYLDLKEIYIKFLKLYDNSDIIVLSDSDLDRVASLESMANDESMFSKIKY